MCLSKYVKVCFIGTIITTVSDVLSLVTRNYPTVCTFISWAWTFSDEDDAEEHIDFDGDPVSFSLDDSFIWYDVDSDIELESISWTENCLFSV